jgi:hypothetical protein
VFFEKMLRPATQSQRTLMRAARGKLRKISPEKIKKFMVVSIPQSIPLVAHVPQEKFFKKLMRTQLRCLKIILSAFSQKHVKA